MFGCMCVKLTGKKNKVEYRFVTDMIKVIFVEDQEDKGKTEGYQEG